MHKVVLKVAVELSAAFLFGTRIASIASFRHLQKPDREIGGESASPMNIY